MPTTTRRAWILALLLAATAASAASAGSPPTGRNVVLVLVDGLRWQEVFTGADAALLDKESGGIADAEAARATWWRESPEERRRLLLPFLWTVVAREGQLLGNRALGSAVEVANAARVSYPGYSEMIVGFADPAITGNAAVVNPNRSVFEWLAGLPAFRERVAVIGAWDRVAEIAACGRGGVFVNAGLEPITVPPLTPEQVLLNRLKAESFAPWPGEPADAVTFYAALEYVRAHMPRALWLTFGETDEWAHARRYDRTLMSAQRTDAFIAALWREVQAMPATRGTTTLIVAGDHGRGRTGKDWTDHGKDVPGAGEVWIAALGPLTAALGERRAHESVTLSQVAATVAAALGEDYAAAEPRAAHPIPGVIIDSGR